MTHLELSHSRIVSIIRYILNNGEAWPTVGAVDERIQVTTVVGIEQLPEAISACGDIR